MCSTPKSERFDGGRRTATKNKRRSHEHHKKMSPSDSLSLSLSLRCAVCVFLNAVVRRFPFFIIPVRGEGCALATSRFLDTESISAFII